MAWFILFIAGLLEICWAIGLKLSAGFTHLGWTLFTGITLAASMFLLATALRTIPVGTGYAVWTGIGATGAAILGMVLFSEPRDLPRLFFLGLIVAGILGLRWVTPPS